MGRKGRSQGHGGGPPLSLSPGLTPWSLRLLPHTPLPFATQLSLSLLAGFDDGPHMAVLLCLSAFFIAVSLARVPRPQPRPRRQPQYTRAPAYRP